MESYKVRDIRFTIREQSTKGIVSKHDNTDILYPTQIEKPRILPSLNLKYRRAERILSEEQGGAEYKKMLYGPFGKNSYPKYAQKEIVETFLGENATPQAREGRKKMFANYTRLEDTIKEQKRQGNRDIIGTIREFMKTTSPFALKNLTERTTGLAYHLDEFKAWSEKFFLENDGTTSRFKGKHGLSDRHAQLLTYVAAEAHDMPKYLGSEEGQIAADHELFDKKIAYKYFKGQEVELANRVKTKLTKKDVRFLAELMGDHENLKKEEGRSRHIYAKSEITRAKALFFIGDVLTGVLQPTEAGSFTFNQEQFNKRFVDLYKRHMAVALGEVTFGPKDTPQTAKYGKVFRPQWGAYAIVDLTTTLNELQKNGLHIEPIVEQGETISLKQALINGTKEAIKEVIKANDQRITYNSSHTNDENYVAQPEYSKEQLAAIQSANEQLVRLEGKR